MRYSQLIGAALGLLVTAACVEPLPLAGAPCPCGVDLVCGQDNRCQLKPVKNDGGPGDVAGHEDAGPDLPVAPVPALDALADLPPDLPGPPSDAALPTSTIDPCGFEPLVMGCGADGLVYGNACDARAARTTFTPGTSCQSTGSCGVYPQMSAVGSCDKVVGWYWAGEGCEPLIGCACSGDGCQTMYPSLGACQRAHTMCKDAVCNSSNIVCATQAACLYTGSDRCGRGGTRGECAARPSRCPAETRPVCGCDGRTYAGPCAAQQMGTDIDHDGACTAQAAVRAVFVKYKGDWKIVHEHWSPIGVPPTTAAAK